jgi:hypothetical protein
VCSACSHTIWNSLGSRECLHHAVQCVPYALEPPSRHLEHPRRVEIAFSCLECNRDVGTTFMWSWSVQTYWITFALFRVSQIHCNHLHAVWDAWNDFHAVWNVPDTSEPSSSHLEHHRHIGSPSHHFECPKHVGTAFTPSGMLGLLSRHPECPRCVEITLTSSEASKMCLTCPNAVWSIPIVPDSPSHCLNYPRHFHTIWA